MRRAIELNPSYTQGFYWYAFALSALGRTAESRQCMFRAHELEPFNLVASALYAICPDYFDRRFGRVIDALNDLAELSPEVPIALFFRACLTYPRIEWKRRSQKLNVEQSCPGAFH